MTHDIPGHSPRIEIRVFDPKTASDQDWQAYHAYRRQRMLDDVPDDPVISDDARRHDMTQDWPLAETHVRLALIDGEIAGSTMFWTRRPGTEDYDKHARYIVSDMGVRKDCRRRGVAAALLRTFVTFARDRGYEVVTCSAFLDDGAGFLDAVGAEVRQRTRQSRLQIADIPAGLLDRWVEAVDPHEGLTWEIHTPRVPLERYRELIPQLNALMNSQPLGTLDQPPLRVDLDQIRTWYANFDSQGGKHLMVLLTHGTTVAAMSDVSWDAKFPDRAFQGLTGVAPAWRGKGLAKAVKARQLQILMQMLPQVHMVITTNASVNAAMLAVNTQLGFKLHRETRTYQVTVTALEKWLAAHTQRRP